MSFTLPFTAPPTVEVFAVEDTVAQFVWRRLPSGDLSVVAHHRTGSVEHHVGLDATLGARDIGGFEPATATRVEFIVDGQPVAERTVETTAAIDAGPATKIATISDLHLGEVGFGLVREFRESSDTVPYPLRCALAAVREAQAWGAELLVIKGDITELGQPEEWDLFDALLSAISIPVLAVPGNHDTFQKPGSLDATTELQRRGLFPSPVHVHDLPQGRVVLADSTVATRSWGRLGRHRDDLVEAVSVDTPAMIFTHHHLEPRTTPYFWPPGIQRFDNAALVRDLAGANPDLLISSGHTHRTRVRKEAGIAITEVGATKDFPGVWAGYVVHTAGVRQVVRRVAEPSCVGWTERTHAVVGGIWGRWTPGRLSDRTFTHRWPSGRTTPAAADQPSSPVASESV